MRNAQRGEKPDDGCGLTRSLKRTKRISNSARRTKRKTLSTALVISPGSLRTPPRCGRIVARSRADPSAAAMNPKRQHNIETQAGRQLGEREEQVPDRRLVAAGTIGRRVAAGTVGRRLVDSAPGGRAGRTHAGEGTMSRREWIRVSESSQPLLTLLARAVVRTISDQWWRWTRSRNENALRLMTGHIEIVQTALQCCTIKKLCCKKSSTPGFPKYIPLKNASRI